MAVDWAKVEELAAQGEAQFRALVDDIRLLRAEKVAGIDLSAAQKATITTRLRASYGAALQTLADIKTQVGA